MENNEEKVTGLFRYIKDLCSLKYKVVTDVKDQRWSCFFDEIPNDLENISLFFRDRVDEESNDDSILMSIKKPEFEPCPIPSKDIKEWLLPGWERFSNNVQISSNKNEGQAVDNNTLRFEDSKERVRHYEDWQKKRDDWCLRQLQIEKTRRLFSGLYQIYIDIEKDPETFELVVGNGIISGTNAAQSMFHPIITKRVVMNFDAFENVISIRDSESDTEIYTMLLQQMSDINHAVIKELKEELKENCYHPCDRNDTPDFLKTFIHSLSPDSVFMNDAHKVRDQHEEKLALIVRPIFFMRKRIDGTLKAVEAIIEKIESDGYVPLPLHDLVSGGTIAVPEPKVETTIEADLAAISGEDAEILLSKEANREQLEIAQRIEQYNAVLVQGPPGTGKTHTIANLLGHFLAQGKNVLVTSHTRKALAVLKDKVSEGIQDLCVTVLDDTNMDMERSVDGITEYLGRNTLFELEKKMKTEQRLRMELINKLSNIRKRIYKIKFKEFDSIVYNGVGISTTEAAKYVNNHSAELSYIPGKVPLYRPLPVDLSDLDILYRSNAVITDEVEQELKLGLPSPDDLPDSIAFEKMVVRVHSIEKKLGELSVQLGGEFDFDYENRHLELCDSKGSRFIISDKTDLSILDELEHLAADFEPKDKWMIQTAACGAKERGGRQSYEKLIGTIKDTCEFADLTAVELLGINIGVAPDVDLGELQSSVEKMGMLFSKKEKLGWLDFFTNKWLKPAMDQVSINGKPISSQTDCKLVLKQFALDSKRKQLGVYWDELMADYGVMRSCELGDDPESRCERWIPQIERCLNWYQLDYMKALTFIRQAGLNAELIFTNTDLDSEYERMEKLMTAVGERLPIHIQAAKHFIEMCEIKDQLNQWVCDLTEGKRKQSAICSALITALTFFKLEGYSAALHELSEIYCEKYPLLVQRREILKRMKSIAPDWANSICHREGVHGLCVMPENLEDAWKWKQLSGILDEITSEPFEELQRKSVELSKALRERTALVAQYCAWYHLLKRTESNLDIRQALQGWKKTVKKIGKGTGKNAPMMKKEARKLMAKCQNAVPAWIMPVSKAMESFDPAKNQFDIVIVDEASQSDVTALAIVYMAKKVIIVGDDKQVSPRAIGVNVDQMNAIADMYIRNKIPNWQLYGATSSLYDIAGTTFQPLMLREHFRCVPEIIGYSNRLSYEYKIKPLREESLGLLKPSVINFRVSDGKRAESHKVNEAEAKQIIALMRACIEQVEYDGLTFGVISLLGDEQAARIQQLMLEKIPATEIEKRRIVCGNASHFQGDERNVIFLSMVDSNEGDGPLRLTGEGAEQSNKQRYNVAASRAQDQMWVVHSLDYAKDLKPDDIRRSLLEYAENPKVFCGIAEEIAKKADSPFEEAVAKSLAAAGFHITQQWEVGAYRIDMVAEYRGKTVAIECDGERYHSGEEKIRQDMERQTILERVGWRFIRIRGSEYYRNPSKTIDRVIEELNAWGILPETVKLEGDQNSSHQLLERVKIRAAQIMDDWENSADEPLEFVGTEDSILSDASDKGQRHQADSYGKLHSTVRDIDRSDVLKKDGQQQSDSRSKYNSPVGDLAHSVTSNKGQRQQVDTRGKLNSLVEDPVHLDALRKEQPHQVDFGSKHNLKAADPTYLDVSKKDRRHQSDPESKHKLRAVEPSHATAEQLKLLTTQSDQLIGALIEAKLEYIDKRKQGGFVYVIYSKELQTRVEQILTKYSFPAALEKRGVIATDNRPAWRIIIK